MWWIFKRENGGGGGGHSIFFLLKQKKKYKNNKKCLWNTTSPMMANSKDQKTNILKDLVTKNAHVQYEKSDIYHFEIMTNAIF